MVEQDHRFIMTGQTRTGFKSFHTTRRTLGVTEMMNTLIEGQIQGSGKRGDISGQVNSLPKFLELLHNQILNRLLSVIQNFLQHNRTKGIHAFVSMPHTLVKHNCLLLGFTYLSLHFCICVFLLKTYPGLITDRDDNMQKHCQCWLRLS